MRAGLWDFRARKYQCCLCVWGCGSKMSRPWWTMQAPPLPQQTTMEPRPSAGGGHSGGSIGTLVVVLAAITILGVLAGVIARICGGRHLTGDGDYDFEGWVENKCSTCIDGSLGGVATPPPPKAPADDPPPPKAAPAAAAAEEGKLADDEEKKDGDGGDEKPPAQKAE